MLADPALYAALMLAVFSILFGTRRIDATEHHHGMTLVLAACVGGLSAATGMVIVASVALATMISNDLAMPLLLRSERFRPGGQRNQGGVVFWVRRMAILALAVLAYGYHRATPGGAGNSCGAQRHHRILTAPHLDIAAPPHHHAAMRTTLDLPDDLHRAAAAIAHHSGQSLSRTVADLIRRGLNAGVAEAPPPAYGVHPQTGLPLVRSSRPITADDVAALDDE